jgi:hypothetical protein
VTQTTARYFVQRDRDGTILAFARVRRDESGLWGEYLEGGEWVENPTATGFLIDPLYGTEISQEEAAQIAGQLGGTL